LTWVALSLLLLLPSATSAAPQSPAPQAPTQTPAYRLAIFPWNLLDAAHLHTNIIFSAMDEVIRETGLFDIKFSYYRNKDSRPEMVQKLEQNIKNIWRKDGWFSAKKPYIEGIVEIAKDLNVDAVLMYHVELVVGQQAQDTLKAFLIDVHSRKIYDVTGYTGDFSLNGEGFREIKTMTHKIFASFKRDNPLDMVIVQQRQEDPVQPQVVAQKEEEARLAALHQH
jgi:hypothetical protein